MGYHVVIKKRAEKSILHMDAKSQAIVTNFIKNTLEGCDNPKTVPGCKKLEGVRDGWRWRVGVYRLLGTVDDDSIVIEIFKAGHRRDVYRNLPQ